MEQNSTASRSTARHSTATTEAAPADSTTTDIATDANQVACGECRTANAASRKFCSECGKSLTVQCPLCKARVFVTEKFCGSCGDPLGEKFEKSLARTHELFAQVEQSLTESAFEQALTALVKIKRDEYIADPRLRARAEAEYDRVAEMRAEANEQKKQALAEAQTAFDAGDMAAARKSLESIPEALRNRDAADLLNRVSSHLDKLASLEDIVERGYSGKASLSDMHAIDQLLQLVETHPRGEKLANKLRDHACKAAESHLTKMEFKQGLISLNQVPARFQNDQFRQLHGQLKESNFMEQHLRHATHTDSTLQACATRLKERFPQHKLAGTIGPEIAKRLAASAMDPKSRLTAWAKESDTQRFGIPIDFLAFDDVFDGYENLAKLKNPYAASFAIATGMALSGLAMQKPQPRRSRRKREEPIGPRQYSLCLQPESKKRFGLGKISPGRKVGTVVGVEVSDFGVRAVAVNGSSERPKIEAAEEVLFSQRLKLTSNDQQKVISTALGELAGRIDMQSTLVVAALGADECFYKRLQLPALENKERDQAIKFEVTHQIPLPEDQIAWQHQIFTTEPQITGVLMAARKLSVAKLAMSFELARLPMPVMQAPSFAIMNIWEKKREVLQASSSGAANAAVALLNVGETSTTLSLSAPGRCWTRQLGFGFHRIISQIVKELNLTNEQATATAREPHRHPDIHEVYEAIQPEFASLERELIQSLDAATREDAKLAPRAIFCTGAGSLFPGLLRALRNGSDSLFS